mgnify:FL=1
MKKKMFSAYPILLNFINRSVGLGLLFFLTSCGKEDPAGRYTGQMQDWVHEVFDGVLIAQGKGCQLSLELPQTPDKMVAVLIFQHPELQETRREGEWSIGDGERMLHFEDGKKPDEYYLIKRGVRYAFQTKQGLSNDDGSPVLLMRNEGKSRKASYPLEILFGPRGGAHVSGMGSLGKRSGEWKWNGNRLVVQVKLPDGRNSAGEVIPSETYKYFLQWAKSSPNELELEKLVVMRPFLKEDGSKRQSWMSSLIFADSPRLKPH